MNKNDTVTKELTIKKVKNGNVTVYEIDGQRYVLEHKNQYKGR